MSDGEQTNTNTTIGGQPAMNAAQGGTNANPQQASVPATNNTTPQQGQQPQGAAPTIQQGEGAQQGNEPGTNIDYNFEGVQMPEGFTLNPEESARFIDVIKDMGLNNEQASALVKYGGEYAERIANQVYSLQVEEIKGWAEETKKTLGADLEKYKANCDIACRRLEAKYPGCGIREALNETGAGNKLALVYAMSLLGELLGEDQGQAAVSGARTAVNKGGDVVSAMFPNTNFDLYK